MEDFLGDDGARCRHEWPDKLREIRDVTDRQIWVSEVGVSTFGAEEVQVFGLRRTMELILERTLASTTPWAG